MSTIILRESQTLYTGGTDIHGKELEDPDCIQYLAIVVIVYSSYIWRPALSTVGRKSPWLVLDDDACDGVFTSRYLGCINP